VQSPEQVVDLEPDQAQALEPVLVSELGQVQALEWAEVVEEEDCVLEEVSIAAIIVRT
jgi:hypothetical protein